MKKPLGSQGVLRGKPLRTPVRGAQDDGKELMTHPGFL